MPNPIGHFEICVSDNGKGGEFYRKVFDWDITEAEGMDYSLISTGSDPGGGIIQVQEEMKPYVTVYVTVDDIDATIAKAVENGAQKIQGKKQITPEFGFYGMFADPDGNVIGLWSKT